LTFEELEPARFDSVKSAYVQLGPHSTSRTSFKLFGNLGWQLYSWETSCQLPSGQKLVRNYWETRTQLVAEWPIVLTLKL